MAAYSTPINYFWRHKMSLKLASVVLLLEELRADFTKFTERNSPCIRLGKNPLDTISWKDLP